MNSSALSLRPPLLACTAAPGPVNLPNETTAPVLPLDLLIVTSRADFYQEATQLLACAQDHALQADTLFIEDLEGSNDGERLQDLHRKMGQLRASGKLPDSAATCVTLHGMQSFRFGSPQELYQHRPHLGEFIRSLGDEDGASAMPADDAPGRIPRSPQETGESSLSESDADSCDDDSDSDAPDRLPMHFLTRNDGQFRFPSDLFCLALRQARRMDGTCTSGYQGVIFLSSCHAGQLAGQLGSQDGGYLILSGKKTGIAIDAADCMREAIDLMAERKRQPESSLTARDYWLRLRHVSGEHIACVMDRESRVHKPLEHSEPLLALVSGRSAVQPQRVLEAKLAHGSARALQAVFDKYGKQRLSHLSPDLMFRLLAFDEASDPIEITCKLRVLENQGISLLEASADVGRWIREVIDQDNLVMLAALLSYRRDGRLPEALLAAMPDCLFDLDDMETPNALQALCAPCPELEELVTAWLIDGVDWLHARQRPALVMEHQPYFLDLAFAARCSRLPAELCNAISRHGAKTVERYRMDYVAQSDRSSFVHDPGLWLNHALCRALIEWHDTDEAHALIAVASSLDSPIILKDTLDIAYRYGKAQGQANMIQFLRAHGFSVDS